MSIRDRPRIILNAAMTIDGRITTKGNDSTLSNEEDWRRVHLLRNQVDAIMVGRNTVLKDDPKLTVKEHLLPPDTVVKHPTRIIVTSKLDLPLTARVFSHEIAKAPTIVATTTQAPRHVIEKLTARGIEVIICENANKRVDLPKLMKLLRKKDINTILLEGGGKLNWYMLKNHLIDEIMVQVASKISGGGEGAVSLFDGDGFLRLDESPHLKLLEVKTIGKNNVLLHYGVHY